MPRWEHGSEERLRNAAIKLFDKQGFDATSVPQIAARARVTTRTFFRYFADKREVLFARSDTLRAALIETVLKAPDIAKPLQFVVRTLVDFDWASMGSREFQRQRQAIIAANPELLERDLSKNHAIAVGLDAALRDRGVSPHTARLAAHMGTQLFMLTYVQWLEAGDKDDLAKISGLMISRLASMMRAEAAKPGTSAKSMRNAAIDTDHSLSRREAAL